MKQTLLLIFILQLTLTVSLKATHIVGGEFELIYVDGFNYKLNLIQYFDDVNGNPGAEDHFTDVSIFRKSDNAFVQSVRLFNVGFEFVPYTNPECADARLITRRILYTADIQLQPSDYSDEAGYYVVYERCCRNYTISNLDKPRESGQTFYLEFPPVMKNGEQFVNSSPVLFPPLSDYACVNELFYFDFRGTDNDGDSLSYRLSVPLNSTETGANSNPQPVPSPAPHPLVEFVEGVALENMVSGTPNLSINEEGFLTVRPDRLGLYVFAVTVDEFRDGVKIGTVKRDFQMLVIDCQVGTPPKVSALVPGDTTKYEGSTEVIRFTAEDEKCIQLLVTDPDTPEKVTVRAKAVNFDADLSNMIPDVSQTTTGVGDTLKFDICLPNCPFTNGEPAIIDFLVMDDACSLPLIDTMRMIFEIEEVINETPYILDNKNIIPVTLDAGESYELVIQGKDDDGDFLSLDAVPDDDGFRLRDVGMSFQTILADSGQIAKVFRWTPDCERFNLADTNRFSLTFHLDDGNQCTTTPGDSLRLDILVNLPENREPTVSTNGLSGTDITVVLGETLKFNVIGDDVDNDFITLEAQGNGFDLLDANVNFQNTSGIGRVGSVFSWEVSCDNVDINQKDHYEFLFIAKDEGVCNTSLADTLRVNVHILPSENVMPEVTANGPLEVSGDKEFAAQTSVGDRVFFRIEATDADNDVLLLTLDKIYFEGQELDRNLFNFSFSAVQGIGRVTSRFFWVPDCIFLKEGFRDSEFRLVFRVTDNNCFEPKTDTVGVTLRLTDQPVGFEEYVPPNVFSPNGDDWNQYFELPNLPVGSCANKFEYIEIYNRWGTSVYISQERDFQWHGEGAPPGVYFYQVKYGDFIYKGTVSLLR